MTPPVMSTASSSSAGQVRPPLHSGPQQPGVPPPARMVYGHPEEAQRPRRPITEEEIRDAKYIALRLRAAQAAYELPARPGEANYAPDVEGTNAEVNQDENDTDACGWWAFPPTALTTITLGRDTHLDVAAPGPSRSAATKAADAATAAAAAAAAAAKDCSPSRSAATRNADAAAAAAKAAYEAARDWSPPGSPTSPSVVTDAP